MRNYSRHKKKNGSDNGNHRKNIALQFSLSAINVARITMSAAQNEKRDEKSIHSILNWGDVNQRLFAFHIYHSPNIIFILIIHPHVRPQHYLCLACTFRWSKKKEKEEKY